ncbi:hypothetical protein M422DRAFT_784073 [Sphaerobolus stellatus SS14]|uniref:Protein kinase domain-containing protein n=1 Tax=Sphaerobolus stellatus (strain SS14) TaxID=990650 RepID=A0A0C9UXS4_SPHS4|nr:hypothetical protein M422DRAFT_784073 [Sphaerobolus stellatus SS14]
MLLRYIKDQRLTKDVIQLEHYEELCQSGGRGTSDGVFSNRKISKLTPEQNKKELIHTRLIMYPYTETIDNFKSPKELLLSFYDAVRGHRQLHQAVGILHRNISIKNILLNAVGGGGNRGILIDFDNATRINDTSECSKRPIAEHIALCRVMSPH